MTPLELKSETLFKFFLYVLVGCKTEIHRKSSLRQPHCQMTPDGDFVCYIESNGIIMRNINDVQRYYRREAFFRYVVDFVEIGRGGCLEREVRLGYTSSRVSMPSG